MSRWYATAVVRLRWSVVAGWVVVTVAVVLLLPGLDEAGGRGQFGGLTGADNPALRTEIRSFQEFGFPILTRTAVVQRDPDGLSAAAQFDALLSALEFNAAKPPLLRTIEFALPVTNSFGLVPGSREDGTTVITYLYFRPDVSFAAQTSLATEYAKLYASEPDDHLVGVTGVIPGRFAQLQAIREWLGVVERATVALIIVIVALNFRALGAALVTIATAGLALAIVLHVGGWAGERFGLDIPHEIEPVLVALLLGIVTDYSIFFLAGMRERLLAGDHRLDAARHSAAEFGPIVFVAGLTVAGGSLALLVAQVGAFRAFGPGMALTIMLSLLVAVTFVPAALAIAGPIVFWPSLQRQVAREASPVGDGRRRPPRWSVVRLVARPRNAALVVAFGAIGLLAAAAPVRNLELGLAVTGALPGDAEPARAAEAASEGFFPGILSPVVMLVEGPGITERREELVRLEALVERQPGVASIVGPREQPSPRSLGAVLSRSGNAARYVVFADTDPLDSAAINDLQHLRAEMPRLLAQAGIPGATASFAGDTALAEAVVGQTEGDLVVVILVACGFGFVLLVIFLRALVAPLYLMAANLLAVGAALGLTTLVFQGQDQSGLTFYVPFAAAVLLIALASDYSIFGVGYIWAEARARPLDDAVSIAVPRSTRAITAAGITLAMSFAILAVVPLSPFREFAFAMSVGILLDVFVGRSLLIPGLIRLVGPVSGWPGHALRQGAAGVAEAVPPPAAPPDAEQPEPASQGPAHGRGVDRLLGVGRVVAVVWLVLDRRRGRRRKGRQKLGRR